MSCHPARGGPCPSSGLRAVSQRRRLCGQLQDTVMLQRPPCSGAPTERWRRLKLGAVVLSVVAPVHRRLARLSAPRAPSMTSVGHQPEPDGWLPRATPKSTPVANSASREMWYSFSRESCIRPLPGTRRDRRTRPAEIRINLLFLSVSVRIASSTPRASDSRGALCPMYKESYVTRHAVHRPRQGLRR
jgi:hypothetical protein